MDVLPEVLRAIRLDSAIFFNVEFSEPWCLMSQQSRTLAPVLAREAGHLIMRSLHPAFRRFRQESRTTDQSAVEEE